MIQYLRHFARLSKRLYWVYRWKIAALVVLGFAGSMLDALSIGILVPLFSFVLKETSPSSDVISRTMFDVFDSFSLTPGLETLLVMICSLFILKAAITWTFDYARNRLMNSFILKNREALYAGLLSTEWSYLIEQKIGYLDNILMVDLKNAMGLFKMGVSIIATVATFLAYLIVAVSLSAPITITAFLFGFAALFLMKPTFSKARLYSKQAVELNKATGHFINESIIGLKSIKAAGAERGVAARAAEFFEKLKGLSQKTFLANSPTVVIEPLSVMYIAVVFAVSYRVDPGLNVAAFLAIMFLVQRIFDFIKKIQANFLGLSGDIPAAERVIRFMDEIAAHGEADRGHAPFVMNEALEFRNVSFAYRPGAYVLRNINFSVKRGEVAAVIGKTGEGKTTIADLVLRLLNPAEGSIFLDGRNIRDIKLSEWREHVGYVSQDIFLKNDTIAENIAFFDGAGPSERLSKAELVEATKKANIYDFIQGLPRKFDTIVGERGIMLSGGQRQRIALARAFARKPKILILDEATSALDKESESLIEQSLERMRGELTVIIISHRLSFVARADKALLLEDGRVAEEGRPSELLKNRASQFSRIYHL